jgi:hypothetical protein
VPAHKPYPAQKPEPLAAASPPPPPYKTKAGAGRPDIGEAVKKEPVIKILMDTFDGEVLY